ncbi:MAG TPA: tripartite tricarboxylate transporter substrate binding protein [Burkholderiales bacterium]|nr:tripartite tricarboxylate transporter substrate binding protein [Burkholderiales bacterium]
MRVAHSCVVVALVVAAGAAFAQDKYPAQPVQVIIPYSAGGNSDVMGRAFLDVLSKMLGGQFVVVNRDGAGGTIGFAQLAVAKPDGYTLLFGPTSAVTSAPHLVRKLPYSLGDFTCVCQVFENIFAIAVAPKSRFQTLKDLVDYARANPGKVSFGSSGIASVGHLSGEGFAHELGLSLNHVPFRGDAQTIPQVLGGQIDFGVSGMGSATGALRPLAIFSDTRLPFVPDVPTTVELGMPAIPPGYQGLFAPRGLAPRVLATLEKGCADAVNSETYKAFGAKIRQKVAYVDSAGFTRRAQEDYVYKGRLIRALGIASE